MLGVPSVSDSCSNFLASTVAAFLSDPRGILGLMLTLKGSQETIKVTTYAT